MQNLYIKIPDGANVVIDKLYENGHSAFVVGGCVRDFILEKEPHDWDICTDALPEQVMQIFGEKNVIPTGIKHGTVTVLIGNDNYEVTTYRIDGMYSDGRRPDNVEFTQNLIEDLSRRDFSINAMAYNDKIGLIDPFDGISDIKNRRICCVGDPGKRFGEDYLRILRAIRFSSTFGFIIDKHTRMVAAINAPNLRMLANERVGAEIRKILCGRYAADVIDENKTSIAWVIPEIIDMVGCEQNNPYHVEDVFQHTLSAMRNMSTSNIFPAEWVDDYVRCALFFHDIGKPKSKSTDENGCDHFYHHAAKSAEITYDILTRLRFNSKDRDIIVELVKNHDMELVATKACARRMLNKFGVDQLHRLLKIRECDNRAHSELAYPRFKNTVAFACCVEEVLDERSTFSIKNLAVNGNDLIAIGFKQGPAIGSIDPDTNHLYCSPDTYSIESSIRECFGKKPSDFKKLTFEDELTMRKKLCNYFVDARWFGMVNTSYSSYNTLGKIEGAFQLSFPMSYDPIRIASISNTRCCVSSDDERKGNEKVPKNKDRTMGRFSVVEYGLYHMYIQTSTKAILRNGVTEDDLKLLIQTILHMFDDDMSSVRPSMTVRKVVVVRQNRNSGRVRPTDIEDAMVAKLKPGVNSPTSFNDYNLEFKRDMLPDSVEVKEYTMDNPDGIIL